MNENKQRPSVQTYINMFLTICLFLLGWLFTLSNRENTRINRELDKRATKEYVDSRLDPTVKRLDRIESKLDNLLMVVLAEKKEGGK
jgi:hypothetical protein